MKSKNFAFALASVAATPTINTEFSVSHDLNAVPLDALLVRSFGNARLYKSTTTWTKTTAYFKSDGVNARFVVALFR